MVANRFRHQETQSSRLKTLDLYWVSRDANKLDWFQSLFSMEKTMELFRTGLIRIQIYFTSTSSRRKPIIKRGSTMSRSKSQDSSHSLPLLRTEGLTQGRYSEDDEDGEEHDDLLSPLDRPIGSSSLISLTSIHSPPTDSPTTFSGGAADAYTRSLEDMEQGEGDAIIGPDNIHLGRPNFKLEFDRMKTKWSQGDASSGSQVKVGVFYCGSPGLGRTLGRECQRVSTSRMKFSFVEE